MVFGILSRARRSTGARPSPPPAPPTVIAHLEERSKSAPSTMRRADNRRGERRVWVYASGEKCGAITDLWRKSVQPQMIGDRNVSGCISAA